MRKPIFWIIGIFAAIMLTLFVCSKVTTIIRADSIQGRDDALTVTLNTARDSAWVIFSYPDDNAYDSTLCLPAADSVTASKYLVALEAVNLDSVGCHNVIVRTFTSDTQTADTLIDQWCNFGALVAEPGAGYMTYPCTLFVLNSSGGGAVVGASVTIRPLGGGVVMADGLTNANGRFIYKSDIASISVFLLGQGWDFDAEDTLVIAGAQTDTIEVAAFSPSAPADQTGIFCWLLTPSGDTIDPSYVLFRPVKAADSSVYGFDDRLTVGTGLNKIVISKNWTIKSAGDTSYISFSMFPNSSIYVNGVKDTSSIIEFKADFSGNETRMVIEIRDTTNVNPFAL